ncbi:hypothetical protein I3J27_21825 [Bradyrhizobium xenonodulans]|uniref:Uncharacterized protein n=1 Tax=Bradyrhizobium xenonodulans TaxID=2736875 RepID=A0ABY7MC35_9BRAD|nr:hypothetical protein [Bradyrhizobium xenonodulans]WBL75674.1 hypothetical protein I3J27_21825 [Bradyrhizobium xenonodulans]
MDIIAGFIVSVLELVVWLLWWVVFDALPTIFYFTALALLFAVTFGKVTVEVPKGMTGIGWTGFLQITRCGEGRVILSPALGVIVGFVVWTIIVSGVIIAHAYQT